MTNQHPITPPPELRRLWAQQAQRLTPHDITGWLDYVATQAARWGADQELEACCEALRVRGAASEMIKYLRTSRRPNPPTLKEQALQAQQRMWDGGSTHEDWQLIRRALEALPND